MPKTKEQKQEDLQQLTDELGKIQAAVMADYHGLTVREMQDLRAKLREQGVTLRVVKNTLFKKAADDAGLSIEQFTGPVGLALGFDDAVQTAKVMHKFAKDHEALELTGGIVEGK